MSRDQQCHRAGDVVRGLYSEKSRECGDLKLTYLLCWPTCFSSKLGWCVPWKSLLGLGPGIRRCVEGRKVGRGEWRYREGREATEVVCYRELGS